jgi:hypothetical protein
MCPVLTFVLPWGHQLLQRLKGRGKSLLVKCVVAECPPVLAEVEGDILFLIHYNGASN